MIERQVCYEGRPESITSASGTDEIFVSSAGLKSILLNFVGVLPSGPKLPALTGNRLLYRDAVPTAMLVADGIQFLEALDPTTE